MTYLETVKYLWDNGEFKKCYDLTHDSKVKDLIDWVEKNGGIEHIPQMTTYTIITENSYLYNLFQELRAQEENKKKTE